MIVEIPLTALLSAAPCPPAGAEPIEAYEERARQAWADGPPEPAGGIAGGDPSLVGAWQPPVEWPVIGIHAAVLPTGKVLHYSYPSGTPGSKAMLYTPATGQFENVSMSTDLFCSGLSLLPGGQVFVTGGNDYDCEFMGRMTTFTFDPFTQVWTPAGEMTDGRWYPTNLTLGDGRVIIHSGQNTHCETNPNMEIFSTEGGLALVPEGMGYLPLFPRLHLLSDGRVVVVGELDETFTFEFGTGWTYLTDSNVGWRSQGTSVLLPGRTDEVMIMGGYVGDTGATATCEVIDFGEPAPEWSFTGSMNHARAHADALILPDATVMISGGGTEGLYEGPVNVPELYDPDTGIWTALPEHAFGRMYHATTVLLPDGRVLVTGQDNGASQFWGEIYLPPYLFRGRRPVIDTAPVLVGYGQGFTIAASQVASASVQSVAMIRLSAVTHSVNFEQRYVGLEFSATEGGGGTTLAVTAPANPNLAPPGYYLLFVVNDLGVPSVARMIRITDADPADVNQDGTVNVADLVAVILAWGPCPPGTPCPADVTGDGVVDVADLVAVILGWG